MINEQILRNDEKAVLTLRSLYKENGYKYFKMSKFEEYDLYSRNKDFLVSDGVITFNDTDGKLLALKPDVTLSIIKNSKENSGVERYYYNENVYRISETSHSYKEIMQTGLECIGAIGENEVFEVVSLALKSLEALSQDYVLDLSHQGFVNAVLNQFDIADKKAVLTAINEKNADGLAKICQNEALKKLTLTFSDTKTAIKVAEEIALSEEAKKCLDELKSVCDYCEKNGFGDKVKVDFSLLNSTGYYSGVCFRGYIGGIAERVLSGGQYDILMRKMHRNQGALGFAVYLDTLERIKEKDTDEKQFINVALPKGRLGEKVYAMFENAGFECPAIKETNRKLIFENKKLSLRFFWVKPSDVAIYVERGAADIGVAGKDILLEYEPQVYELLDLKLGKCRMAVAAKKDFEDDTSATLRVATKFSNIAKKYYAEKCRDIDIIHLNGSIEIAPILGLSDVIVDIVETGKTLLENDLVPFETIVPISARLIANKSSFKFKTQKIEQIKQGLEKQVKKDD
ncbi:MAG: ATP phosphoribosyltransferase [Clostridia bacterium]|nr:ATP phosphoribosyltransferase [Clostridia bacterium]